METVHVHSSYGSVKPGEYRLVGRGYDYYEIKFGGGNLCIPGAHIEGQPMRRQNFED